MTNRTLCGCHFFVVSNVTSWVTVMLKVIELFEQHFINIAYIHISQQSGWDGSNFNYGSWIKWLLKLNCQRHIYAILVMVCLYYISCCKWRLIRVCQICTCETSCVSVYCIDKYVLLLIIGWPLDWRGDDIALHLMACLCIICHSVAAAELCITMVRCC